MGRGDDSCLDVCVCGGGYGCMDVGVDVKRWDENSDHYISAYYCILYDNHNYVGDTVYFTAHFHK